MSHVDFYFDFSSPFAYLGATQIEAIAERAGATLSWKPMFLGGVFKAVDTPMVPFFELSEQKRRYIATDMQRWAKWWDVSFNFPSQFPMMTVKPLRMCLTLDNPAPFIHRVFAAYWSEGLDISTDDILAQCCKEVDLDPALVQKASDPEAKKIEIETRLKNITSPFRTAETTGQNIIDPRETRSHICSFLEQSQRVLERQVGTSRFLFLP